MKMSDGLFLKVRPLLVANAQIATQLESPVCMLFDMSQCCDNEPFFKGSLVVSASPSADPVDVEPSWESATIQHPHA